MQRRDDTDYDADVPPDAPAPWPGGESVGLGDPMHAVEPERAAESDLDPVSGQSEGIVEPLSDEPSDAVRQEGSGPMAVAVFIESDGPEPEPGAQEVADAGETGSIDVEPAAYAFDTSDEQESDDEAAAGQLDGFDEEADGAARAVEEG